MAFDAFLKIDGIEGESTDDKHQNWIEISAFSHGMTQRVADTASSAGARASERASHGQFVVIKDLDKASPKLAVYLNQGKNIDKIRLELCRATGEKTCYMVYELHDVIVGSVAVHGKKDDDRGLPTEEVSFAYGKITWTYTVTDTKTGKAGGNIEGHWSVVDNNGG